MECDLFLSLLVDFFFALYIISSLQHTLIKSFYASVRILHFTACLRAYKFYTFFVSFSCISFNIFWLVYFSLISCILWDVWEWLKEMQRRCNALFILFICLFIAQKKRMFSFIWIGHTRNAQMKIKQEWTNTPCCSCPAMHQMSAWE